MKVESQAAALDAVSAMCRALGDLPEGVVFNARLVACELLTNAIKYGGGSALFSYSYSQKRVRIAVRSAAPFDPPQASLAPDPAAESGRGLFLVDTLAECREYSDEEGIIVTICS